MYNNIIISQILKKEGGLLERINTISSYLKEYFSEKTVKLAIDGGFTCPNRDGSKGYGGCLFCSESGSGDMASNIDDQIKLLSNKWPKAKYLAYFQNHTNTYEDVDILRKKFYEALNHPQIEGIVISTRPDSISEEVYNLLSEINKIILCGLNWDFKQYILKQCKK